MYKTIFEKTNADSVVLLSTRVAKGSLKTEIVDEHDEGMNITRIAFVEDANEVLINPNNGNDNKTMVAARSQISLKINPRIKQDSKVSFGVKNAKL